jgi:hypothetical protein
MVEVPRLVLTFRGKIEGFWAPARVNRYFQPKEREAYYMEREARKQAAPTDGAH